ncbi:MAG: hypothetical protein GWN39_03355, partial [Thermoplasmata archaeon]|nr:hypothetical protein [Thermoplasmata archaeon]NIS11077.1 hypothetical protein [Thermoplasmata archaeon]NIV77801.1 hypothetical protein [Thermoplasmata archaeon]NIW87834.1 hypothetical protein [Thermoplasmata archaeon]
MDLAISIDIDENGTAYVIDSPWLVPTPYTAIKVFDRNGTFIDQFGSRGSGPGQLYDSRTRLAL